MLFADNSKNFLIIIIIFTNQSKEKEKKRIKKIRRKSNKLFKTPRGKGINLCLEHSFYQRRKRDRIYILELKSK